MGSSRQVQRPSQVKLLPVHPRGRINRATQVIPGHITAGQGKQPLMRAPPLAQEPDALLGCTHAHATYAWQQPALT